VSRLLEGTGTGLLRLDVSQRDAVEEKEAVSVWKSSKLIYAVCTDHRGIEKGSM
jgi:hypothetical protein